MSYHLKNKKRRRRALAGDLLTDILGGLGDLGRGGENVQAPGMYGVGGLFDIPQVPFCQQPQNASNPACTTAAGVPTTAGTATSPYGTGEKKPTGPGVADVVGSFLNALTGKIGSSTMTPAQPVVVAQPSGPSTTTMLAIGGAALLAVLLLTRD